MIKYIDAHCNCFIELTLHPISAIDISKVQSCAIPKEYTKHFPSIMSWNKSSRHNSLSPSDAAPRQWSFIESFFTLPGIDPNCNLVELHNTKYWYKLTQGLPSLIHRRPPNIFETKQICFRWYDKSYKCTRESQTVSSDHKLTSPFLMCTK